MPDNSTINYIKETITTEANNWGSTLTDWMNTKYGIPLNSQIIYNDKLSDMMTNLFTNTKVNVYLFTSKKVAIIAIPGANKNIKPEILRAEAAVEDNAITTSKPTVQSHIYETFSNAIQNCNKDGGETKLIYHPSTKKFSINIPEVTVYISTNYINCLDYDDEIIASVLQQIAINTRLFRNYIIKYSIISLTIASFIGLATWTVIPSASMTIFYKLILALYGLGLILFTSIAISIYVGKCRNIEYDEFAIKCGYGDALRRAVENYNKYLFGDSNTKSGALENLNTLDSICHWFNKMIAYVENMFNWMGITTHQSINRRNDTIEEKTKIVDQKNPDEYIDRSNSIQEILSIIDNEVKLLNEEVIEYA